MIAMHFRTHPTLLAEYKTVTVTLIIGTLWELCLIKGHVINYEGNVSFSAIPMWVVTFWAALGTTFNGCLSRGKQHLFLIAILAALTGPLMTYGGSLLGVLHLQDPLNSSLIIASGWAVLAPFLFFLADYFFRTSEAIHRN
jgi:glucose-6-phosphate-specific signal transduction histidine kinase